MSPLSAQLPTIVFSGLSLLLGLLLFIWQYWVTGKFPDADKMKLRQRLTWLHPDFHTMSEKAVWGRILTLIGFASFPVLLFMGQNDYQKNQAYATTNWLQEVSENPSRISEVRLQDITYEMCRDASRKDPDVVLTNIGAGQLQVCVPFLQQFECEDLVRIVRDAKRDVPVPEAKYRLCLTEQIIAAVREGGLNADDANKLAMVLDK